MDFHAFAVWVLGDKPQFAIAGALGGLVRWITLRNNWKEGLATVIVGGICAVYLTEAAIPIVDLIFSGIVKNEAARASISAFVVGVGGMGIAGFIIDLWRARFKKIGNNPDADG